MRCVHDKQPLGSHQLQQAKIKETCITLCVPVVSHRQKPQPIPLHVEAIRLIFLLSKLLSLLQKQHSIHTALANCLHQWIMDPTVTPAIKNIDKYPSQHSLLLRNAIDTQTTIGWILALQGHLSIHWYQTAQILMITINQSKEDEKAAENHVTHILQTLFLLMTAIWEGHNNNKHKNQDSSEALVYIKESSTCPALCQSKDKQLHTGTLPLSSDHDVVQTELGPTHLWLCRRGAKFN